MSPLDYRHQRVQRLRRLVSKRSSRQQEGRFVIEGVNLLQEALASDIPIEAVFIGSDWRSGPAAGERLAALVQNCYDRGSRIFELAPGVLARVAGTVTPQPVMAVLELPEATMATARSVSSRFVVVLVDVRDPGNAGTVARTAWAAGAGAVICCDGTVDLWNPKSVRSSAGAVLHIPIVSGGNAAETLAEVGSWGLRRWAAVPAGGEDYASADLAGPTALVLGNEAGGLALSDLDSVLDGRLSIPMSPGAESLNVGMAAAVLCFEVARQRRARVGT